MAVRVVTKYVTDDGVEHADKLSADKYDLATSAGTTTAAVEAQVAIVAGIKTADVDAAFEAAIAGAPALPAEDAIRRLSALFLYARHKPDPSAAAKKPAAPDGAGPAAAAAVSVTTGSVSGLAENLAALNNLADSETKAPAPAPAPVDQPDPPKPDIFAHNR